MSLRLFRGLAFAALVGAASLSVLLPSKAQQPQDLSDVIKQRIAEWEDPNNPNHRFAWLPLPAVGPVTKPPPGVLPAVSVHIGLNRVSPATYPGTAVLGACVNDATSMRDLAVEAGFQAEPLLLDEQATHKAVVDKIRSMKGKLPNGGTLLVTYAGHGSYVRNNDPGGDPEETGQDQTWCLFDRMIIDDELYALWSEFPSTVTILMVSDSCHSGTVARFVAEARKLESRPVVMGRSLLPAQAQARAVARAPAGQIPLNVPSQYRTPAPAARAAAVEKQKVELATARQAVKRKAESLAQTGATVVLLAACQDSELSQESGPHGLFTEALLKNWRGARTYEELQSENRKLLEGIQRPNLFSFGPNARQVELSKPFSH